MLSDLVGKTYLASAIANALIEKEISVKMTNFATILNDMMNLNINKNKYIEKLNKHRLLIIDDFGMERDTLFAFPAAAILKPADAFIAYSDFPPPEFEIEICIEQGNV